MKKLVVLLVLVLIVLTSAFCDSGDYITIICKIDEIKPTFTINTDTFEDGTFIYVAQDNMARYLGAYKVDVKLTALSGEYEIINMNMVDNCNGYETESGLQLFIDYDGRTSHPHTIASWTMSAVTENLHGTVTMSFQAI
jgi:hypothetical protein